MIFDSVDIAIRVLFWLAVLAFSLHPAPLTWAKSLQGLVAPRRTPVTA